MEKLNIYEIDREYRNLLKKTCLYVLAFNRGLPLEWEDLYNNFLIDAPKILEGFEEGKGMRVRTFLQINCKNHCFNYCRTFKTNKHKVMNKTIDINLEERKALGEAVYIEKPIDISVFSPLELIIYNDFFLEGITIKDIAASRNISPYKIRALSEKIKVKIRLQLKNWLV